MDQAKESHFTSELLTELVVPNILSRTVVSQLESSKVLTNVVNQPPEMFYEHVSKQYQHVKLHTCNLSNLYFANINFSSSSDGALTSTLN